MNEKAIRLDELHSLLQSVKVKDLAPFNAEVVMLIIDRAEDLVGLPPSVDRRVMAVVALHGTIEEAQVAWLLVLKDRATVIRAAVDRLVADGRVERRGGFLVDVST